MRTEQNPPALKVTGAPAGDVHTHPQKRGWRWFVAAFVLCPCHLPLVLAILGTGVLGGVLARNQAMLLAVFGVAFAFALWRGLAQPNTDATLSRLSRRREVIMASGFRVLT